MAAFRAGMLTANVAYLRDDETPAVLARTGSGVHCPRHERRAPRLDHSCRSETTEKHLKRPRDPNQLAKSISDGVSTLIFAVLLRRADPNVECHTLHDDLPAEITFAM
jgi:hypothetical protein